ncbi:hypothetical protein JMJ77_0008746 [Colletotrichum scovillei]|uniref:Uncharacterized protein n=1 Tax=Colletotrichum scovillei TaxID=1209932 RepID=A0A9P7QT64_9PEZI|nr:hypothetical protein JMJ78_0001601 [Colletotrichum scovillei]KAG7041041.1 hypothetical protein JMJ77_0008746 [Colletotrichum scovillei]KAG7061074.1 hypothetical protein JMJ76_0010144 [Colletotrichum scovillei]
MLLMTSSSRELKPDPLKLSILETGDLCQRSRQAAKPLSSCRQPPPPPSPLTRASQLLARFDVARPKH